jgi:tetratricopeptide (TPR) repeat protein
MEKRNDKLLEAVRTGDALVLFLGAGAIVGSTVGKNNQDAFLGDRLRDELHRRFFPSEGATRVSLKRVCSSIQSLKGPDKLRGALVDILLPVNPSKALLTVPTIPWRAVYSINVDDSVERAYESTSDRVQDLKPVVLPSDRAASDPRTEVSYYKLHGCLRRPESTLIFSHRDYTEAREANLRMFTSLGRDLCEAPFLFVGFSFEDDDFQDLWQSVLRYLRVSRRRVPSFLVTPGPSSSLVESMEIEGVTVLDFGVETFFPWLRANASQHPTVASRIRERVSPILKLIQQNFQASVDEQLLDEIKDKYEFVTQLPKTNKSPSSSRFLLGAFPSWADIQLDLSIPRELEQDLLDEMENWLAKPAFKTVLVTGGAGYGKSALLMRLAHAVATSKAGVEVLYKKTVGDFGTPLVAEYAQAIRVPVFLVVDDAYRYLGAMRRLKSDCESNSLPVFVLAASRPADWNVARKVGAFDIPARFELPRLTWEEARDLAKVVRLNGRLASKFSTVSLDELAKHFFEQGEKHLLAGLMTAAGTGENDFEKIIMDEYFRIPEGVSRDLYLNVALVHALGVFTPASLACASVGVPLVNYHQVCAPVLDTTIVECIDERSEDLMFSTQHRVIAEALIASALQPASAVDRILAVANKIDPHRPEQYGVLLRLYHEDYLTHVLKQAGTVRSCYQQLIEHFPADAYIKQHSAIFEVHEKNFIKAHQLIDDALHDRPRDPHFLNTKANILLREATYEPDHARAEKLFLDGTKLLRERIQKDADKEIHYLSLIERQLDWARRIDLKPDQRLIILEEVESDLNAARQRYPLSSEIATVAAKLMLEIHKIPDAKALLERSVKLDGANVRARLLLARIFVEEQEFEHALRLVEEGLITDPKNYGLLRTRLLCVRRLEKSWLELRPALLEYLAVAEDDMAERIQLVRGLLQVGDLGAVSKQIERLRRTDVPFSERRKTIDALDSNNSPLVVEGEFQPTGIGKGFIYINGYPKQLRAYADIRRVGSGVKLHASRRLRAELGINGLGLVVVRLVQ